MASKLGRTRCPRTSLADTRVLAGVRVDRREGARHRQRLKDTAPIDQRAATQVSAFVPDQIEREEHRRPGDGRSVGADRVGSQPGTEGGEVGATVVAEQDDLAIEDRVGQTCCRGEDFGELGVAATFLAGPQCGYPVDDPQLSAGAIELELC
jgi:hypothetical protein